MHLYQAVFIEGSSHILFRRLQVLFEVSIGIKIDVRFVLFHLYPHVTRNRWWRYILDESAPV